MNDGVERISRMMEALLSKCGKPVIVEDDDGARHRIEPAAAAAPDGLLPLFLAAAGALWRASAGIDLGVTFERDEGALTGWRVAAIEPGNAAFALLSLLEVLEQAERPDGIMMEHVAGLWRAADGRFAGLAGLLP